MDWAWVAWLTLRLTQRNIERIRNTIVALVKANPGLSAVMLVAVVSLVVAWIIKHARSLEKMKEK